jgi:hypothetical protein
MYAPVEAGALVLIEIGRPLPFPSGDSFKEIKRRVPPMENSVAASAALRHAGWRRHALS